MFFGIGALTRDKINKIKINRTSKTTLLIPILLTSLILIPLNTTVDMNSLTFGNYFLFYISAFLGIAFYILVSQIIGHNKILSYIGQNTLVILVFHKLAFDFIILLQKHVLGDEGNLVKLDFKFAIIYAILQIVVLIPLIYIINKKLPFLVGKN